MTAGSIILSPEQAIRRLLDGIEKPACLLVAISGGSDSTGLLIALAKLAPSYPAISLSAATIDHALRPGSADEARAVAALCERLGIPHATRRWQGEKPSSGISAAGRDARYRLLCEIADDTGATAILAGHTHDDQRETLSMRAARREGESNSGLAGMAQAVLLSRRHWLVRPFLHTRRADIRAFLTDEGQGWIDDPTNLDTHYERVRMRLSADEGVDPAALARAVKRRTAISDQAAEFVRAHVTIRKGVLARIEPAGLKKAAPTARRHALGLLAAVLGGRAHSPSKDSMDRVMSFMDGGRPGRMTAGRVIFDLRREGLYMMRENRGMLPLHVAAGETAVWDGRYRMSNASTEKVVVGPTAPDRDEATAMFPDVPPAIAMRAASAMPCAHVPANDAFVIEPMLAPFDRFLPQFELRLASEIAVLIACDAFPPPPIKDSERKS